MHVSETLDLAGISELGPGIYSSYKGDLKITFEYANLPEKHRSLNRSHINVSIDIPERNHRVKFFQLPKSDDESKVNLCCRCCYNIFLEVRTVGGELPDNVFTDLRSKTHRNDKVHYIPATHSEGGLELSRR